ncbi:MAG: hypothetical protein ACON4O_04725 [Lentimonas sp.]
MNTSLFKILLIALPLTLFAKLTTLTSTDGRSISASLEDYRSDKKTVDVRINGKGRTIPIPMDRLDEASQNTVLEWSKLNTLIKYITITTERIPAGKGKRVFNIKLNSQSKTSVNDIKIDYVIPIKETHLVKEEIGTGKKKKIKYNKEYTEKVITGTVNIQSIKAQSSQTVSTDPIITATPQTIDQGKNKEPKEVMNNHSIKGILLRFYIGDQLAREYESQNGVRQIIDKYRS